MKMQQISKEQNSNGAIDFLFQCACKRGMEVKQWPLRVSEGVAEEPETLGRIKSLVKCRDCGQTA